MKKGLAFVLTAVLLVGMIGCGSGAAQQGAGGGSQEAQKAGEGTEGSSQEAQKAGEGAGGSSQETQKAGEGTEDVSWEKLEAAGDGEEADSENGPDAGKTEGRALSRTENEKNDKEAPADGEFLAERPKVRGIYVTGPMAGTSNMDSLIALVERTELNAMVIDIKNDEGYVTCQMSVPLVEEIGSVKRYVRDMPALVQKCKEKGIYLIARVVAFRDPFLAEAKPEWSLHNADGTVFRDKSGLSWVNPYEKQVWDYLVEVAEGAVDLGFDEVQFDYIRFSTDSGMKQVDFGEAAKEKEKTEVIAEFAAYAAERLHKKGAAVSADVYGVVIDSAVDQQIVGQDYVALAKHLDYLSPMVYPSHYGPYNYNIPIPDAQPYDTVLASMQASKQVLSGVLKVELPEEEKEQASVSGNAASENTGAESAASGNAASENTAAESAASGNAVSENTAADDAVSGLSREEIAALAPMKTVRADVRPWLQDFTATWVKGHIKYGPEQIRAQIQAVYDAGYEEWILWNAANRYTEGGLYDAAGQPVTESAETPAVSGQPVTESAEPPASNGQPTAESAEMPAENVEILPAGEGGM